MPAAADEQEVISIRRFQVKDSGVLSPQHPVSGTIHKVSECDTILVVLDRANAASLYLYTLGDRSLAEHRYFAQWSVQ